MAASSIEAAAAGMGIKANRRATTDGTTKGRKGWRDSRNPCSAIRTGSPPVIRALVAQCDVNLASAPPDNNRDRSGTQGFYGGISTGEAIRVGESGAIA